MSTFEKVEIPLLDDEATWADLFDEEEDFSNDLFGEPKCAADDLLDGWMRLPSSET